MIEIKKTIFWLQVIFTFSLLIIGVLLSGLLLFSSDGVSMAFFTMLKFAGWLLSSAVQSFFKLPEVAIPVAVAAVTFVGSMYCFAQTAAERRIAVYAMAAFPFALLLCSIGMFGAVLSGLASQGAGQ